MQQTPQTLVPPPGYTTRILRDHYDLARLGADPELDYLGVLLYNKALFKPLIQVWEAVSRHVKEDARFPPSDIERVTIGSDRHVVIRMTCGAELNTTLPNLLPPTKPPVTKDAQRVFTFEELLGDQGSSEQPP